jgi:tetratricopeptide (TPR) repeat protein
MKHRWKHRGYRAGIGVALAIGAAVRVVYLLQTADSPFFENFMGDAAHFDRWAKAIAGGNILGSEPFFRAPLYPYLLGFFYWLTDRHLVWVHIIQHAIGLLGIWATADLARHLWDRRAAVAAALLAALYPVAIFFEGQLLLDHLLTTLAPLVLLTTWAAVHSARARTAVVCGIAIGLFAITRPTILLTMPILLGWVYWQQSEGSTRRTAVGRVALVVLVAVLIILPVALRNRMVGGDTVPISSQGGVNFYIGNNPTADGVSASLPPLGTDWTNNDATALAEAARGSSLKPSAVSGYWLVRGLEFWRDHPSDALRLWGRKCVLFWQSTEFANNLDIYWFTDRWGRVLRWLPVSFGLIVALGAIGWAATARQRPDRLWLLAWSLCYTFAVTLFFIVARFRLPIVPVWIGAAAAGLIWFWDSLRAAKGKALIVGAVAFVTVFSLVRVDWFPIRSDAHQRSFLALGNIEMAAGRTVDARAAYDSALAVAPGYRGVWLSRGTSFYLEGQLDSAAESYQKELDHHPNYPAARVGLAHIACDRADTATAYHQLEQALTSRPYHFPSAKLKATLLRAQHRPEDALKVLSDAGILDRHRDRIASLLGVIYLDLGRLDAAEEELRRHLQTSGDLGAVEADPDPELLIASHETMNDRAIVHYNLAVIAGYRGEWRRAINDLISATSLDPSLGVAWANLATARLQIGAMEPALEAARQAITIEPRNPIFLFTHALASLACSDTAATITSLTNALEADSSFRPAVELMETVHRPTPR